MATKKETTKTTKKEDKNTARFTDPNVFVFTSGITPKKTTKKKK